MTVLKLLLCIQKHSLSMHARMLSAALFMGCILVRVKAVQISRFNFGANPTIFLPQPNRHKAQE